jgi:steroid delta-isomerase-like uncharacterized protein
MSSEEHKQLIFGLVDEVWNHHNAAAIDRYFGPGLREEVTDDYQQLLRGFPDLQVRIEDDLIAEGDMVVALLTVMGTHTGTFAGRDASGRFARWSSIRIYRIGDGKVAETWAMQDRLGLLQQLGALPELLPVNWAGGNQRSDAAEPARG